MKIFQAIATYLICQRVTSSQAMAKWFVPLYKHFRETIDLALLSGEFFEYVRSLQARNQISSELAQYLLQLSLWLDTAYSIISTIEQYGIKILLPDDPYFPQAFLEIADSPAILFVKGDTATLNSSHTITLVGTRSPSAWAKTKAKQLAMESVNCGLVTVSGFAGGIDTIIHEETLLREGKTIAIIPQFQVEQIPEDNPNIVYLSEYPPCEASISKWQFIARNRLLAALGSVTVIVEAPIRSGTLITAELALTYGKPVYVVLPDPNEESAYGGQIFGITETAGVFVQSLYDILYQEGKLDLLEEYKKFVYRLSSERIVIKSKDHRHLAHADLRRYLYSFCKGDLSVLDSVMVELHRFGIIRERKNKIVFNFSGYNSWPKI